MKITSHKIALALLASVFVFSAAHQPAFGQDASKPESAKQDTKDAGTDVVGATKKTGIAKTSKKVAVKTKDGTETAAEKTKDGAETVGKDTAHGTKVAAEKTAHGTKKVVHGAAKGTEKTADKVEDKTSPN